MTEEFFEKMKYSCNEALKNTIRVGEAYKKLCEEQKEYVDLYTELVLAAVETFDFYENKFKHEMINKDVLKKFGKPKSIYVSICEENNTGRISLDYGKDSGWGREGEPKFKKDKNFDLETINFLLNQNGISIKENSVDGGGYGYEDDEITFDATMLIELRKQLLAEEKDPIILSLIK